MRVRQIFSKTGKVDNGQFSFPDLSFFYIQLHWFQRHIEVNVFKNWEPGGGAPNIVIAGII